MKRLEPSGPVHGDWAREPQCTCMHKKGDKKKKRVESTKQRQQKERNHS